MCWAVLCVRGAAGATHPPAGLALRNPPRPTPQRMRAEFWETSPHYGGSKVIWDALQAAASSDDGTAALILASAGVVFGPDGCLYDERGARYRLPPYVLSDPRGGLAPG